jgi:hypothetical protein
METHIVKYKFLHCNKQKKIIEQMYGNEFDNFVCNREKYLAFLDKVVADNRVEELNNILGNNDMNCKYYHNGYQGDKVVSDNRVEELNNILKCNEHTIMTTTKLKNGIPTLEIGVLYETTTNVDTETVNWIGERVFEKMENNVYFENLSKYNDDISQFYIPALKQDYNIALARFKRHYPTAEFKSCLILFQRDVDGGILSKHIIFATDDDFYDYLGIKK